MISKNTIEDFTKKYQTSQRNVLREYFQHLFLYLFYQQDGIDKLYFKGGTALRLVYKSPRFSEDLDFGASFSNVDSVEDAIVATLLEAEKEGVKTALDEAKKTSGGYLSIMQFSAFGLTLPIKIEISFRDKKSKGEIKNVSSDLFPDYAIIQLVEEQLVQGKLDALLDRKKPRDFYDFYFLMRHNMLPEKGRSELLEKVLDNLQKNKINFSGELKEFLPKSHHMIIRDFKKTIEREIKRYV